MKSRITKINMKYRIQNQNNRKKKSKNEIQNSVNMKSRITKLELQKNEIQNIKIYEIYNSNIELNKSFKISEIQKYLSRIKIQIQNSKINKTPTNPEFKINYEIKNSKLKMKSGIQI